MSATDIELLQQWRRHGDAEAFNQLVLRHAGMVYATCRRILRDSAAAEDAAQESFLALATTRRPVRSVPGVLHSAATNSALNHIRKDSRRRIREQAYAETRPVAEEAGWDDLCELVDACLEELPRAYREALVRHFLEGETHDAIASKLGITRSGVTRRCNRGIVQLRQKLRARGVVVGMATLGILLSENTRAEVPGTLRAALGRIAVSGVRQAPRTGLLASAGAAPGWLAAGAAGIALVLAGVWWVQGPVAPPPVVAQVSPRGPGEEAAVDVQAPVPAASEEPAADAEAEEGASATTLRGVVLSSNGFPRPTAYVNTGWPHSIYQGGETDAAGRFEVTVPPGARQFMAYCQYTQQAALFELPGTPGEEVQVVLTARLLDILGRVTTSSGQGVPKAPVQLLVTKPDGVQYLSSVEYSDKEGYYHDSLVPGEDGYTIQVRLAAFGDLRDGAWSAARSVGHRALHVEMPQLVVSPGDAEYILANAALAELSGCEAQWLDNGAPRSEASGLMADPQGRPIPGVAVEILYEHPEIGMTSVNTHTDAQGRWRYLLPRNAMQISLRPTHPQYEPWGLMDWNDTKGDGRIWDGSHVMNLVPGVPFAGRVVDAQGAPVADALLLTHERYGTTPGGDEVMTNAPIEEFSTVRSDASGNFRIACLPAGEHEIQILKPGAPVGLSEVHVEAGMAPVTLRLTQAESLTGQVVDAQGGPVPFAAIRGQEWVLDQRRQLNAQADADAEGRFAIANVPAEGILGFQVSVPKEHRKPAQSFLTTFIEVHGPRDVPYTFTLYEPPAWRGSVVDADTGAPVEHFEVRTGFKDVGDSAWGRYNQSHEFHSLRGRFIQKLDGVVVSVKALAPGEAPPDNLNRFGMAVFAEGYLPAEGETLGLGEASASQEIRLQPGEEIHGIVVDVNGDPQPGVTVAWIGAGECAHVRDFGLWDAPVNAPEATTKTDEGGAFTLPPRPRPATLFAIAESGYAEAPAEEAGGRVTLELLPWAEVHVRIQGFSNPETLNIALTPRELYRKEAVSWDLGWPKPETDSVIFSGVPALPLLAGIGRHGYNSYVTHGVAIHPQPGQILEVVVEASGVLVEGRVMLEEDPGAQFGADRLRAVLYAGVAPEEKEAWSADQCYVPEVEDDGRFRVEGVPPGSYTFCAEYTSPHTGSRYAESHALGYVRETLEIGAEGVDGLVFRLTPLP